MHLDDDEFQLLRLRRIIDSIKIHEIVLHSVSEFQKFKVILDQTPITLALIDLHLNQNPESETGFDALELAKQKQPNITTVAVSNDLTKVTRSLQSGASDFISKTNTDSEIATRIAAHLISDAFNYSVGPHSQAPRIAVGATMLAVEKRILKIVKSAIRNIYVEGPTGAGKEIVVDLLERHIEGNKKIIRVNCAAIAPEMLESELFGHVKGAFTGALSSKRGLIESASSSWLFLDEVNCLSTDAQSALLRAIENQEIKMVGATNSIKINTKFIAASNVPLQDLVDRGKFRNDLWQRLRETEISLPPLSKRKHEVKELVQHFASQEQGGPYTVSDEAMRVLTDVDWDHGNARAIRNCIRAMTELQVNKVLTPRSIPLWIWKEANRDMDVETQKHNNFISIPFDPFKPTTFRELSERVLTEAVKSLALSMVEPSLRKMASDLGMPKTTLATKLKACVQNGLLAEDDLKKLKR